jgi:ABC-type lipoprotein export system ATPase subunit
MRWGTRGEAALVLTIRELRKGFQGPDGRFHPVLDLPAFDMAKADQVALSGESGSGKTTLLNLIAGIQTPDSGSIEVAGEPIHRLSESARDRVRARSIGYVFQSFNLLQGHTCLENVLLAMAFGRGADRGVARTLLERVELGQRLNHYPRHLSSGQQQRVAVARALSNHPGLILADEPTGNLDRRQGREVLRLLRETTAENGAALLLVSHDPAVLADFGRREDLALLNRVQTSTDRPGGFTPSPNRLNGRVDV